MFRTWKPLLTLFLITILANESSASPYIWYGVLPKSKPVPVKNWSNKYRCTGNSDTSFRLTMNNIMPYGFSANGEVANNPFKISGKSSSNLNASAIKKTKNGNTSIALVFHTKTANARISSHHYTGTATVNGYTRNFTCLPSN